MVALALWRAIRRVTLLRTHYRATLHDRESGNVGALPLALPTKRDHIACTWRSGRQRARVRVAGAHRRCCKSTRAATTASSTAGTQNAPGGELASRRSACVRISTGYLCRSAWLPSAASSFIYCIVTLPVSRASIPCQKRRSSSALMAAPSFMAALPSLAISPSCHSRPLR